MKAGLVETKESTLKKYNCVLRGKSQAFHHHFVNLTITKKYKRAPYNCMRLNSKLKSYEF